MSEQKYKTLETYANILNEIFRNKGFSVGELTYPGYKEINLEDLLSRSDLEMLLAEKKVSLKEGGESFIVQSIDEEYITIDTTSNPPNPQKKQITEDLRVSLLESPTVCKAKGLDITKLKDGDVSRFGLEMADFIVLQDQLLKDLPSGTHNLSKEEMENAISKSLNSFRNFLRDKLDQENSDLYKIIEEDYSNDLQGFCRFINKVRNSQLELSSSCKDKMHSFLTEGNFTRDVNSIMESISTKLGFNIRSIVKFTPEKREFVLSEELHSESNLPSGSASNASVDSLGSLRTNDSYR